MGVVTDWYSKIKKFSGDSNCTPSLPPTHTFPPNSALGLTCFAMSWTRFDYFWKKLSNYYSVLRLLYLYLTNWTKLQILYMLDHAVKWCWLGLNVYRTTGGAAILLFYATAFPELFSFINISVKTTTKRKRLIRFGMLCFRICTIALSQELMHENIMLDDYMNRYWFNFNFQLTGGTGICGWNRVNNQISHAFKYIAARIIHFQRHLLVVGPITEY